MINRCFNKGGMMKEWNPGPATIRALEIIRDYDISAPKQFALFMWPESAAWQQSVKCGVNGSHRGGGMYRTGGAFLGRLQRRGLLRPHWDGSYTLSAAGRALLAAQVSTTDAGVMV